jgi:hypothetical protein
MTAIDHGYVATVNDDSNFVVYPEVRGKGQNSILVGWEVVSKDSDVSRIYLVPELNEAIVRFQAATGETLTFAPEASASE